MREAFRRDMKVPGRSGWSAVLAIMTVFLLIFALLLPSAFATGDLTVFGPTRFDRLKGKPTEYTDTFKGCREGGQAVLRVTNGDDDKTRITSAEISVNNTTVADEDDFKRKRASFDIDIVLRKTNTLAVKLKSGRHDDDGRDEGKDGRADSRDHDSGGREALSRSGDRDASQKDHDGDKENLDRDDDHQNEKRAPSFLVIEIIAQNCDSTPPVISNPVPGDGALLKTATPSIAANYADEAGGSGIDVNSVSLLVDGNNETSQASVSAGGVAYTPSSPLAEGAHTVTVNVSDLAHNPATLTWHFTTDTIPPGVTITAPADTSITNARTITVTGTVSEPISSVTINGMPAVVSGLTWNLALSPVEGLNTITAQAVDLAGNAGTATIKVTLDTQPPALTLSALADGSYTNNATLNISGTATDNTAVQAVTINGTPVTIMAGNSFSQAITLRTGPNTITTIAADTAGNTTSDTRTIILDQTAPVIAITNPMDNSVTNVMNLTVTGSVDKTATVTVTVNGGSPTAAMHDGKCL